MIQRAIRLVVVLALASATFLAAAQLRVRREKPYDVEVVPPASALRWLSLGHPLLAANFYWLKTVQYIGEERADERGWDKLSPLVELVTDLDPGHGYAYQVAGIVLASANRVGESNHVLEKGTRNVPSRYVLPYFRAFNAFYYDGDWDAAGRWAEIAARAPGAPAHVRQNVLAYYVKGNRTGAAIEFLERARAETQDRETAAAIEEQLRQAYLERDGAVLDAAIAAYRARHGAPPVVVQSLVADGLVARLPEDPFGGEWVVGADGRVRSSKRPFRFSPPSATDRHDPNLPRPEDSR